ncbi:MAG: acyltransferase, partial [Polyangiaceae bacterium]
MRPLSAEASPPRGIGHFSALDGLRGLALLGVLFFHAKGVLPGGYLGVDLFFVLSGFLITSLLLAEHERTGKIGLVAFWVRRARRLFPALLSLMPAVAAYGWLLATPGELATVRGDALATLAYVANWRTILAHK